jgi:hypothetical protein
VARSIVSRAAIGLRRLCGLYRDCCAAIYRVNSNFKGWRLARAERILERRNSHPAMDVLKGKDSMKLITITTVLAPLAMAAIVLLDSNARAAGCGNCHFQPGKCPTQINQESFGYYPTMWQLWPGTLDPRTSYPSSSPPTTMPAAEPEAPTLPAPSPNMSDRVRVKPARKLTLPLSDEKANKPSTAPADISTYQVVPAR